MIVLTKNFVSSDLASEDSKPAVLHGTVNVPRKTKVAGGSDAEPVVETNGTNITGKRKREGEDEPVTNGRVSKRFFGDLSHDGDEDRPIFLNDDDGGAILID